MPKHIFFQQRQNDIIYFITDEMEDPSIMKYKDFKKFLSESFYIDDWSAMIHELDSFEKVFIDMNTKKWQIVNAETNTYSFEELYDLNKPEEIQKPLLDKLSDSIVNLYNQIGRHDVIETSGKKHL